MGFIDSTGIGAREIMSFNGLYISKIGFEWFETKMQKEKHMNKNKCIIWS